MNFITREVPYNYDPTATCPEFLNFLNRIFRSRPDKEEIIQYLQKGIGYSLTGDTSKQVIFLLHGSGANGKSTLIETIRKLMGEYGTTISANALTTKKNDSVRNDIARLMNVRFVSTSENAIGTSLDEELIKNLTGGDQVAARFLFQEEFLFHPHLKLWWAFNHPPGIRDMTHSLWRRLKMIPFEERIPDREQIPQYILLAQFEKELSGIFNWAITGLKKFQSTGMDDVTAVSEAVEHFREDQDVLFDFIKDCCYIPEQQTIEPTKISESIKNLFSKYIEWANKNNIDSKYSMSKKRFSQELADRGFKREHLRTGNIFYGIQIL
jgi:putative DNA primase/helicase